jgi:hypothetical protein
MTHISKKLFSLICLGSGFLIGMENEYLSVRIGNQFRVVPLGRPAYIAYPVIITNKTRNTPASWYNFDSPVKNIMGDAGLPHIVLIELHDGTTHKFDMSGNNNS